MVNFVTRLIRKHKPCTIVFVCTANRARSPYAVSRLEFMLLNKWYYNGRDPRKDPIPFQIVGAGIHTTKGSTPLMEMRKVAWERGLDVSDFIAAPFNIHMERRADLVLTMEDRHTRKVIKKFPKVEGRIHRITDYERNGNPNPLGDIPDPTIGSDRTFREIADIIDIEVARIFPHVLKLVGM